MQEYVPCLSVIIVNYNTRELVLSCLSSLFSSTKSTLEIILADNNSSDGSAEATAEMYPTVKIIKNSENLGFARANNEAIEQSKGKYILLLNPDTYVLDGAADKMLDFLKKHPQAGAVGCQLLNRDGSIQVSAHKFPRVSVAILEILGLNRLKEFIPLSRIRGTFLGQWLKSYYGHFESQEKVRPVDFVTGACLMVRREILDDVGLLDENFFMYAEEIDWCYRMKLAGWKVYYYPEAKIIHYIAQSSAQVQNKAYLYRMFSIAAYFHKHGNMLCRAAIRTGMFIRASGGIIISLLTRPFRLFCPAGISKSSRVYYQLLILSLRSWAR